jgi:polysaccharide biosynthesis transport protein
MRVVSQSPRNTLPASESELDFSALGAALWRRKWSILGPTILVAALTLVAVQLVTPRFSSEARVYVEGRDNIFLRPDVDRDTADRSADQEAVTSQAQIILSRDLAREVIQKLKLGERPEFDPALNGVSPIKAVLGLLGLVKDPLSMTPEERVLNAYYDRLTVVPLDKSRIIDIDFVSEDPELAARVANAIADSYLVRQREAKVEQARNAAEWLSGEIDTMRKKVEEAEAKAEDFRAKNNLLIGTNNTTLSAQQLGELNTQLATARSQKADAEARARMIRDMLRTKQVIESSDILNSELIRRLSEQRVTLRAQLAEQSSSLLDGHPRIKELRAQIADLDIQLRDEADKIARSLENDAKLANARLDTLTASLDQLKGQAATTNEQDVQLRALEREAKAQRDLLESYLAKYREAIAHQTPNSSPADARVISRATVSNVPSYPKKLPTVLIATLATLMLSSGWLLTKEILSAPVRSPPLVPESAPAMADADSAAPGVLGPRVAAILNEAHSGDPRAGGPAINTTADVARALREGGGGARVAVLSAKPGISTGHVAIGLSRMLAEHAKVVLVGLVCGDGAIKAISSEPGVAGLAELAQGTASYRDIITKDSLSALHLIAAGHAPSDRLDILSAPGMTTSFLALARSYDYLVLDAGEGAGPALDQISEIAPLAVLVVDGLTGAAAASARERLLAAGFGEVIAVHGARTISPETAAAA